VRLHQHWALAVTVMCYLAMTRRLSIAPIYNQVKTNPNINTRQCPLAVKHILVTCTDVSDVHQKYFSLTSTKDLIDNVDVRNIIALIKETISAINYNVVIHYLSFSVFRFYIIQIPLLLTLNAVKYFL